jgi:hypothetical protein
MTKRNWIVNGNRRLINLAASMLLVATCWSDQLIHFDFARDLGTTQIVAQVTPLTQVRAAFSTAARDLVTESARASSWLSTAPANYLRFSFAIEAGYVMDVSGLQFDYMSQRTGTSAHGPTQYEILVGVNGGPFRSMSGGWKNLSADGVWHRDIMATHGGVAITNLSGYVTVALTAKGAVDKTSRWYVDNLSVLGQVRAQTRLPVAPYLASLVPKNQVRITGIKAGQFYSLQYAPDLNSTWNWVPGAVNLSSPGSDLLADIRGLNGPRAFMRGVTSFDPIPSLDIAGFWRITSTNTLFGNGVIRLVQTGNVMSFEERLLGEIKDDTFTIAEDEVSWMTGTVTGDALNGRYAVPLSGMAGTNNYAAIRYAGPTYDVWQGTNALTASQYYDPGAYGYSKIGQGTTTATFAASQPYLVVCANTLAPIDALEGPNGGFVDDTTVLSNWIGNASSPDLLKGKPDSRAAGLGHNYSGQAYRGYVAFGPVSWNSLTVHLGSLDAPTNVVISPIPANLLRQTFFLEHDSDGMAPTSDAEIALVFEPKGAALLYFAFPDYADAYRGSYTYTNGQLSLKFDDPDFNRNVRFAMDLTSPKVSMPFDVFTPDTTGPSVWRREESSVAHTLWIIFAAATIKEQLPIDQALARARAYADALVAGAGRLAPLNAPQYPILLSTESLGDGVRLNYDFGDGSVTSVDVQLLGRSKGATGKPLTTSPLYADPRVHLNVTTALDGSGDPAQKSALLVVPFYTKRMLSWNPFDPAAAFDNDRAILGLEDIRKKLAGKGYEVRMLLDEEVSVINLIRELTFSPGLIYFSTHGGNDGRLSTGTYLGTQWSEKRAFEEFARQKQLITDAGYGDLLLHRFHGETPLGFASIHNGMTKKYLLGMVAIKPAFWDWLRSKGANFGSSLVYIGACQTSETPSLRDAIRARVLFSYDSEVAGHTVAAVGRYLTESLARKTRTAEETYYNLRRVVNTGQMIYAEDARLNGSTDWWDGSTMADHFHGYATLGPNSTSGPDGIMEYDQIGWLGAAAAGHVAAGDVWWLLFGGRWSQNAQSGGDSVKHCWDEYWSVGRNAGLADTFCQNCSPGPVPNENEVAYAIYLLTGQWVLPFNGVNIPRWTLNDGSP